MAANTDRTTASISLNQFQTKFRRLNGLCLLLFPFNLFVILILGLTMTRVPRKSEFYCSFVIMLVLGLLFGHGTVLTRYHSELFKAKFQQIPSIPSFLSDFSEKGNRLGARMVLVFFTGMTLALLLQKNDYISWRLLSIGSGYLVYLVYFKWMMAEMMKIAIQKGK